MNTSRSLTTIAIVAFLTLAGCGGGGGDDAATDSGGSSTQSSIDDASGEQLLTRLDSTIPGCTYVESSASSARTSAALPDTLKKIRVPESLDTIPFEVAATSQEYNCTDDGKIVMTSSEDQTTVDIDFQECGLETLTIDGMLGITLTQDTITEEITAASASTDTSGVRIIDHNVSNPQDVTLTMTNAAISGLTGLSLSDASLSSAFEPAADSDTTGSQSITLDHLGVKDNLNDTQSIAFDACDVDMTETEATNTIKINSCTVTDDEGTYTVSSTDIVQDLTNDQVDGVITVHAEDGSTMVLTFDESTGEILVSVNGETPMTLDCREAYDDNKDISLP